ncbi:MAG: hypothetical protein ACOX3T_02390 [Bdellovibrionota bacterium]
MQSCCTQEGQVKCGGICCDGSKCMSLLSEEEEALNEMDKAELIRLLSNNEMIDKYSCCDGTVYRQSDGTVYTDSSEPDY